MPKLITKHSWPSIPFRTGADGKVPDLDQSDAQYVRLVKDAFARIFDLSAEADLLEYNKIIDRCAKGLSAISQELCQWDEKKHRFVAFLRWVDYFYEFRPPSSRPTLGDK